MKVPQEVLRNCIGLGLVACRLPSMREDSLNIFEAVKTAAPESSAWIIGTAMVRANADDDPEEACSFMMKQGVSARSGDLLARAFLGLFLVMANRRAMPNGSPTPSLPTAAMPVRQHWRSRCWTMRSFDDVDRVRRPIAASAMRECSHRHRSSTSPATGS